MTDAASSVQLHPRVINLGPASRRRSVLVPWSFTQILSDTSAATSTSLVSKWQRLVHPEGKPYFLLSDEFTFNIVTEANIEDIQTQGRIFDCITVANEGLHCHDIKLPPRCELFLELAADHMSCNYYFVDHIGKGLFWLEDVCTDLLNILPSASASHIGAFRHCRRVRYVSDTWIETELERLYWVHVEFFPMHHESHEQQFSQIVDDLCDIISHAQAGKLYRSCTVSLIRLTVDNRQNDVQYLNVPLYDR